MNYKHVSKLIYISIFLFASLNAVESKPLVDCVELIIRKIRNNGTTVSSFSYNEHDPNGPSKWPGTCNTGRKQSPIVYDQEPVKKPQTSSRLKMIGATNTKPREVNVVNTGYGATYSLVYADNSVPQITGGPLKNDVYNFHSFHFHYPCEHLPKKFQHNCRLELHFVHFNSKYGSIENAMYKDDGLAVIGVMYGTLVSNSHNMPYVSILNKVYQPDTEHTERNKLFTYADAIGFNQVPKFVSYKGSLTTPTCVESVTWIVVDQLFSVSAATMLKIRGLRDGSGNVMLRNNRPLQPLNNRPVYKHNEL